MKREPLELVRLGQGGVRHACLPPDWILRSLLESMSIPDGQLGGPYVNPDAKFLQQRRAICGRYGVPNMEPYDVPTFVDRGGKHDPAHLPVCKTCALALAEIMPYSGNALQRAVDCARRALHERKVRKTPKWQTHPRMFKCANCRKVVDPRGMHAAKTCACHPRRPSKPTDRRRQT